MTTATIHYLPRPQISLDEILDAARQILTEADCPLADKPYQVEVMRRLEGKAHLARLCGAAGHFDPNPVAEVIELAKYHLDD